MTQDPKRTINAPCKFLDDRGKTQYPAVDCAYACEICSWNPEEAKRRIEQGKLVDVVANGRICKSLSFPKREFPDVANVG